MMLTLQQHPFPIVKTFSNTRLQTSLAYSLTTIALKLTPYSKMSQPYLIKPTLKCSASYTRSFRSLLFIAKFLFNKASLATTLLYTSNKEELFASKTLCLFLSTLFSRHQY